MTTSDITLDEISSSKKFQAIQNYFTADALDLINRSETMKSMVRAYEQSTVTIKAELWTGSNGNAAAAQYRVPAKVIIEDDDKGQLSLGTDRISTATGLVDVLSHKLGHFVVENPGAIISNARANAWEAKDAAAYADACHLTEGYARLATAKVVAEINNP